MTCRVHYLAPDGSRAHKDVAATREDAPAVFRHLFPGVSRIERVEPLGGPRPSRPKLAPAAPPVAVGSVDGRAIAQGLRAFRERLAHDPKEEDAPRDARPGLLRRQLHAGMGEEAVCPTCGGKARKKTNPRSGVTRIWTLGCGHGPFPPLNNI